MGVTELNCLWSRSIWLGHCAVFILVKLTWPVKRKILIFVTLIELSYLWKRKTLRAYLAVGPVRMSPVTFLKWSGTGNVNTWFYTPQRNWFVVFQGKPKRTFKLCLQMQCMARQNFLVFDCFKQSTNPHSHPPSHLAGIHFCLQYYFTILKIIIRNNILIFYFINLIN